MRYRFPIALVGAFVALSLVADRGAARQITGTVVGWEPGESITIASEQTDPQGVEIRLRSNTVYDGVGVTPGAFVRIWYRSVGERRGVADKVLVINTVSR